jgi:hypothetical protein
MSITGLYSGCFTKQIYLQGKTLPEIERILGFHAGRLSQGAKFVVATQLPGIDDFDLAGYTQVAGHHTTAVYGNINSPAGNNAANAYRIQKQNAMRSWGLTGTDRLVKVLPAIGHDKDMNPDKQYPPGQGVPQWIVKWERKINCREICEVKDYFNGRFVPEEGFKPVNYGR